MNKAASTLTLESMLINKRASAKLIAKNLETGQSECDQFRVYTCVSIVPCDQENRSHVLK